MVDDAQKTKLEERSEVTSVVRHTVRDKHQAAYEAWLKEILPVASRFPGHRGVNVIRPASGSTEYTVVLHFDTIDHLQIWLDSQERRDLIAKVLPELAGDDRVEIKTGLEFWFTPPSTTQLRARPYKQFLVTLSVIFPLTLIVPTALRFLEPWASLFDSLYARQLVADSIIVGMMTYVIMPRYTRLVARWLFK
jgi:antibiotic biosynthesis monooxygenase (ABM) superfamily enzyme